MVHELTHMVEGSHSSRFYKLMDELHDEVDRDISAMRSYPSASFIPFNKGIYRAIHHFHHNLNGKFHVVHGFVSYHQRIEI